MSQGSSIEHGGAHHGAAWSVATRRVSGVFAAALDTTFDEITRMAAHVCQTPIAACSLIDVDRVWFKAEVGLGIRELPRDVAICAQVPQHGDYVEIDDIDRDERFMNNPLVSGTPHVRFYAAALLRKPNGEAAGALCVLDTRRRTLDGEQIELLCSLARQAMMHLELQRSLDCAERAQRSCSRLMAATGHDLRQPLSAITLVIDLLRQKGVDPSDLEALDLAAAGAAKLKRELDRLACASQLSDELLAPALQAVSLPELMAELSEAWRQLAERKGLRLETLPCSGTVLSCSSMLRSILDNLVSNALKYTARGSVTVRSRRLDREFAIEVLDTGRGIPNARLAEIFEAFRQLDPESEGLGLGLSIVRRTADALGHRLEVDSDEGRGSTFRVIIPSAEVSLY